MFPLPPTARRLSLALLLAAAAPPAWAAAPAAPLPLDRARPRTVPLAGGEARTFTLRLGAGEYARVVVMQRGIDVVVSATSPAGAPLAEVDSPNGTRGPEPLAWAASEAGEYRLRVASPDSAAAAGEVDVRVEYVLDADQYRRWAIVPLEQARLDGLEGVYELGPKRTLYVGMHDDLGGVLTWYDTGTRRLGVLHAHSDSQLHSAATVLGDFPVATEFEFRRAADGRADSVTMRPVGGAALAGRRVGPRVPETVTFASGALTLHGRLTLPVGPGPHPGLVLVQGSGPATRRLAPFEQYFAHLGFAVLAFDKRGAGESQGDWRTASFDDLAADVTAAVDYLRGRPEVDGARVGLWGVSQGGWVGTLAALRSPAVRFVVMHAGSGVTVWENVAHEDASGMRDAGLSAAEVAEGQAWAAKLYRMASDGAPYAEVMRAAAAARGKPYADLVWLARLPESSPWWEWWRKNGHVDPAANVARLKCPTLWFLGDRDSQVPLAESEQRLRAAFAAGGNADGRVVVLVRAGHPFLDCETGLRGELPQLSTFVPGYFDVMGPWLRERAGLG